VNQDLGTLVGGGDCQDHYHNSDRFPTRDTLIWLQSLERVKVVTTNYTVTQEDDIIAINGSVSITLPPAKNGRHYKFSRLSGTSTIYPSGSDTINGAVSHSISGTHGNCHLKAYSGGWLEI
jgi:hypothetical protein